MDKRGQFYLIIVFILSLTIYGVTYQVNKITEPFIWEDFDDVSQNYISESAFVINSALRNKEEVNPVITDFTKIFLNHSQRRNPNLGLLYIYSDGTDITLKNYLNVEGSVNGENTLLGTGQQLMQDVTIEIAGKEFIYKVPVTSQEFGNDWSSAVVPGGEPFNLSLAGVIHPFDLTSGPEFKVIIRSVDSTEQEVNYGDSNVDWDPQLSFNVQQAVN